MLYSTVLLSLDGVELGDGAASSTEVHYGPPQYGGRISGDVYLQTLAECHDAIRRPQVRK